MADKSFGVKQLDVLGTGTPTISAPNILNLDCHTVAISTSITIGENLTVSGSVDLGNASSDTISLTGVVDTNIIPSADSSKDIGSNSVRFANGYFDTVYGSGANLTNLPTIAGIWTVTNNSSSNYVITGPGGLSSANNPDLYLERGKTYQFAMNASGHGFGIQTSSGTWNNSNAYTTGITNAGAATGTITFAVPYSAPARLYYACTSQHSGMVGNLYIQGAASTVDVSNNADDRVITGGSGGSLNGESALQFNAAGLVINSGDLFILDSIIHGGNSSTKIRFPSANTISMETNGSERLRIGSSGQIGIAGANYGSSGDVLTSQGGSSAPQWASPSGRTQGSYTQASSLGSGTYTFTGIPSTAYKVVLNVYEISSASQSYMYMRVGSSGGVASSGYKNLAGYHYYNVTDSTRSSSDARFSLFAHNWDAASYKWTGQQTLTRIYKSGSQEQWMCNTDIIETTTTNWQNLLWEQRGIVNLGSNTLDRIVLYTSAGNFDGGYISVDYFT